MFQYAAGRAVQARVGGKLRLDATFIELEAHRKYQLGALNLHAKSTKSKQCSSAKLEPAAAAVYALDQWGAGIIEESGHAFSQQLELARPGSYLAGYWQSEKYFEAIAPELKVELRPRKLSRAAKRWAKTIEQASNPVAVHVRRGDYEFLEQTRRNHGLMGQDYYEAGARLIAERSADPEFFVFSDDPAWCVENLDLPGSKTLVSGRPGATDDIHLMSLCRHFVIPNSSFGWWGAWLGEQPDSVVVAPAKWFDELELDTRDQVPERWLRA